MRVGRNDNVDSFPGAHEFRELFLEQLWAARIAHGRHIARINQHVVMSRFRAFDVDRIPLTDIEHMDFQGASCLLRNQHHS